jgi:hypothetical protein
MPGKPASTRGDILEEAIVLGLIVLAMGAYEWDVRDIAQASLNLMVMRPVLVVGWVLAAVVLWLYVLRPLTGRPERGAAETASAGGALRRAAPMLTVVGMLILYTSVFTLLPFVFTTTLFMCLTLVGLGNRSPIAVATISLATAIGLYLMGERVLGVTLP